MNSIIKYFRDRKEEKQKAIEKATEARAAAIKKIIETSVKEAKNEMDFLVNIGSYKTRQKYKLSDREIKEWKEKILQATANRAVALQIITFLADENEAGDKKVKAGKKETLMSQTNRTLKEFYNG